ncbi:MAG: hypothetical protein ACKORF_00945 [Micrococcales bacterium]
MPKFSLNGFHMRFLTAAVLFVVSVLLFLAGVAERTIWVPPQNHRVSIDLVVAQPLVVIGNKTLTRYPGNPTVVVDGQKDVFVAHGRQADVEAWVADTSHTDLRLTGKGHKKLGSKDFAGGGAFANPAGSDLWRGERLGTKHLAMLVPTAEESAVIIAADGIAAGPNKISLIWPISHSTLLSDTLIWAGLIMLLAAIFVNIWTYRKMRRERGPRRRTPKAPHGPKLRYKAPKTADLRKGRRVAGRVTSVVALGLVVSASVSGCSVGQPNANPSTSETAAAVVAPPPVVTEQQLAKILRRVAASVAKADKAKDPRHLAARMEGPALASRGALYSLMNASNKIPAPEPINADVISFNLPAATDTWPRAVMVVTKGQSQKSLPQMLVLEQATPRSNYQVWYAIGMLPGVQSPEVASATVGAIPVAADSLFLKLAPNALPNAYGDLIDKGSASLGASLFDVTADEFYKQVAASQASQKANLSKGKITVSHSLGNPNVLSLATSNSGALVAVYMTDTYVIKPNKPNSAVTVSGNEKLMLGTTGSTKGIRSVYGDMLLFYVPAVSSPDKITTLGATQVLVSVRSL